MKPRDTQLGFDALLADADRANHERAFERETGHLPSTMAEALPFYRCLIERHHAAMLAADVAEAMRLREEAHKLAYRLNGGNPGILADADAPGCALERKTAAPIGAVPLWGQQGDFRIEIGRMQVRIEMDGMFGICATVSVWPGFSARAIEFDRPFLSETGYRSFLGLHHGELAPKLTPDAFARDAVSAYVRHELRNRLVAIEPQYRERSTFREDGDADRS